MKAIEIENFLKSELVGKEYSPYGYEIASKVMDYLAKNGFDRSKLTYNRNNSGSNIKIYINVPSDLGANGLFLSIETKKKRGDCHRWGYDWKYHDFLVTTFGYETVDEAYESAINYIEERKRVRETRLNKAKHIFELLKEEGFSECEAIDLVEAAKNSKYDLARQVYRPGDKY